MTATFNQAIMSDTLDFNSFVVSSADVDQVPGLVTLDEATNTGVFTASGGNFSANTVYTATITTAVESVDGNVLDGQYQWSFTTAEVADNTAPSVTSSDPANGATDVAINRNISVNFNEAMYVPSVNSTSFLVTDGNSEPVAGTIKVVGTTAVFTPAQDLMNSTEYTATLTTDVKDLAGNSLVAERVLTFTTGDMAAQGPAPVPLGTAGDYVILSKTAITTTGVTAITGDIALSPAALSDMTGFSETLDATGTFATSGIVDGQIRAADMSSPTPSMLTTAISDLETAFTDAAGRSNPDYTELYAGDISGQTLEPGLYKWGTGLLISTDVTLDGNANDVWILQIAGDLTVSNDVEVHLTGGAMAKNVFWQVAGKITFGTSSKVKGNYLSQTLIAFQQGAELNGRALAQTAVTLDANTITGPAQ
ncbi:ice-binding family protein [uncultured Marinobacter sp.]|uniref:ice-binding family protein n=1 Tax=uncultured Marinobacter sp. TaxID=187379 RepID=UPI0030D86E37